MKIFKFQQKRSENRESKEDERKLENILRENVSLKEKPAERRPPHSFIIHTGKVGPFVRQLERDLRRVMSPHTSGELKVFFVFFFLIFQKKIF